MTSSDDRNDAQGDSLIAAAEVSDQLGRILLAAEFVRSKRMADFLDFVVAQTLAGHGDRIKQYTIATKVFDRDSDFDQHNDPIVRVQAAKVRRALQRYYFEEGANDSILIEIPKGTYVPTFQRRPATPSQVSASATARRKPPTVVVMPFANQSGDASRDYLAAGLSEDLSTELSRFAGVSVVAYYSSQHCADQSTDVSEFGKELGADYVVTGSVRQVDPELRVNIQLSSVSDGRQVWGERFRRDFSSSSFHQVQDEVIELVLARIAGRYGAIHESTGANSRRIGHASLSGYEAVLRALYYDKTMSPADYAEAMRALEATIADEPDSPIVTARLAILYLDSHAFGYDAVEDSLRKGVRLAERAVALDPNSQDALYASAWASLIRRDRVGTVNAARRLVDLTPGEAYLVGTGGWFLAMAGEFEEGQAIIAKSQRLNPKCPSWFHLVPYLIHLQQQNYEEALAEANSLGLPDLFWDPMIKAATLGLMGRSESAKASLRSLTSLRPDFAEHAQRYIGVFVLSDSLMAQILEGLRLAGLEQPEAAC